MKDISAWTLVLLLIEFLWSTFIHGDRLSIWEGRHENLRGENDV